MRNPNHAMTLIVTAGDHAAQRKKTMEELKTKAITELECRGYDVRGKTPAQIRQILRRRPTLLKSTA